MSLHLLVSLFTLSLHIRICTLMDGLAQNSVHSLFLNMNLNGLMTLQTSMFSIGYIRGISHFQHYAV